MDETTRKVYQAIVDCDGTEVSLTSICSATGLSAADTIRALKTLVEWKWVERINVKLYIRSPNSATQ